MNARWIAAMSQGLWSFGLALGIMTGAQDAWGQRVIFSTGFEASEGYSTQLNLSGQNGWVGSGADGVVTNFFEGFGQQAYLGFDPPVGATNAFYNVYRPVNLAPIPASEPLVEFSVLMQIVDSSSTNGPWDDFRWSVYNTNGMRLFSLDFDNAALTISYLLEDGADFVSTGIGFDNLGYYELVIGMNFARNLWSATLNGEVIVHAQPITTLGSPLNLGDIDAVWAVRDPAFPGDNYLLFDDYTITVASVPSIQPRLEAAGFAADGSYLARVYGEPDLVYQIQASTDLVQWDPVLTFTAPADGVLEFHDPAARDSRHKFYRVTRP